MSESPNGKAVLTLKKGTGIAIAVLTMITTTTIPALSAADITIPKWVGVALASLMGLAIIIGQVGGGVRQKRAGAPPAGTVKNPVAPEVKP